MFEAEERWPAGGWGVELDPPDCARHIGCDEFGQRVRVVAGNGVETRYRYDESTRRMAEVNADHQDARMRSLGRPARPFQRLRYRYDLVGNVKELSNEVPLDESLGGSVMVAATQQRFEYDDLNQLKGASGSYQERRDAQLRYTLGLSYDAIGNVAEKGQEVSRYVPDGARGWKQQEPIRERTYRNEYRYTGPRPHAATEVDEYVVGESSPRLRELLYDASGNQVEWKYRTNPQRRLEWDDDGRLVSVQENRQELSRSLYDGAGERRVHRHGVAGEEETAYVDQHLVLRNGEFPTKHVFAGETRVASKIDADFFREPPVLYYHPDHLGSTQYITDEDQALSQHAEYLPSGELWADQTDGSVQNRQPYLFNGKELDLSTGLYHYRARSYEPRLGVWLSPDPVLVEYMAGRINGGVYRPINLGLYTYTWNNPLAMTDPTGRWPTAEDIEAGLARAGDTIAGFSYGFVLGVTHIAGNLVGFLPPPKTTKSFRVGMGAGQVAGGFVQMTAGEAVASASARGGAATTLGSGGAVAPIAVPAAVAGVGVGVVLVESGRAAVMQGAI
ncbi:uncharacterized protein SOCE26_096240 [Sorangium cellulosum]|uniref:Teneurin-like YD-shell domain-containing protein n=1 Tax=Sorangium cellulosum TaxID=56 RepID=A0A2L0F946_SORCE|nr:RHS repeat-associated core domain-containing protein [Sorangium cellulosum]AUX48094.1 uncharacterized protein SOCE26_096240 [Sorangium cellulosum]